MMFLSTASPTLAIMLDSEKMMRKCLTYILPNSLCLFLYHEDWLYFLMLEKWPYIGNVLWILAVHSPLFTRATCSSVNVCECSVMTDCCDPTNCSLPDSSVHGTSQIRILEWVAISYSGISSWPRDWTLFSCVSCDGSQILYHCATREAPVCSKGAPTWAAWILLL